MNTWIDVGFWATERAKAMVQEPRERIVLYRQPRPFKALAGKVDALLKQLDAALSQPLLVPAECVITPTEC